MNTYDLRAVTWNVLYKDRPSRLDALLHHLKVINADVVFLQETSDTHAAELARELNMQHIAQCDVQIDLPTFGLAILARFPLKVIFREPLPVSENESPFSRWLLGCQLEINGHSVLLLTTHLAHTKTAGLMALSSFMPEEYQHSPQYTMRDSIELRQQQLAHIFQNLEGIQTDAALFCGDLNFVPDGKEYQDTLAAGWTDAWRAGPRVGSGNTILWDNPYILQDRVPYPNLTAQHFPGASGPWDYTLDYQFYQGKIYPKSAWTVGRPSEGEIWPSDHLGLVVDYRLGQIKD